MVITDIFIKRPVLASVVSAVILLIGLRAGMDLNVRQFPYLQNAQINVSVAYPGADAELMQGFVTTPLEREIAAADGIEFLSSSTGQGIATISAFLRLDKDPNEALTEISAKVASLRNEMPEGSEDAVVAIKEAGGTSAMYLSFYSEILTNSQIGDYLSREIEPQLAAIPGIEAANIIGASAFAMRIWLKPDRMVAHNLTASEVLAAVRSNNFLSAVGETRGNYVKISLRADTNLRDAEAFRDLIVASNARDVVRLRDVANVVLGSESYDLSARWDGKKAIFVGIDVRPDANVLDVTDAVLALWPDIQARLPQGLEAEVGYDSTVYIRDAIAEVRATLVEAVFIVVGVIFLFLGSVRSSIIPAITVPLSLIGALSLMLLMGFSINLLTLLAMVLAIGMVVDDAIIVLENIHRHIENGMSPGDAAIKGARELVGPVIAMTITLVAVYAPIGFLSGITGTLFAEFAFTLAGAVLISGVVALTLTPMMCSKILRPVHGEAAQASRFERFLDDSFERWRLAYKARLHGALNTVHVIGLFGLIVFVSCYFLFRALPAELAPAEDGGFAILINESDGYSTLEYFDQYSKTSEALALAHPDVPHAFTLNSNFGGGTNAGFTGMIFTPWSERDKSTQQIIEELTPQLKSVSGLRTAVFQPPALPSPGQGYPIEIILKSTAAPSALYELGNELIGRAMATKKYFFLAPRLRFDRPEATVEIDREKAALMGVDMRQIAADLSAQLSGGQLNRFAYEGRAYKVIPQVQRFARINPQQLEGVFTRNREGQLVPLSTLVKISERTVPREIFHSQQLNSNTIIGVPRPGISQEEALHTLEQIAADIMPPGMQLDYSGASRQFRQEGRSLLATFAFALIIIYLVLAAQFESLRDPLIMLVTVPMSICGALLMVKIFAMTNGMKLTDFPGMSLNIYTQVGLITLIGVISKHGILIVEFANKLQASGYAKREAIEEAASIRFRPVLMTTAALVLAMLPLLLSSGPGAAARFSLGLVIAAGMSLGTLFTLYVVPAMYLYIGRDHAADRIAQVAPAGPLPQNES